jgi:hypothetical protein
MNLMIFGISGKIKAMNKKKVRQGQVINSPSCYADFPPPYPPGTDY